jgi:hypothetical protein
MSDPAPDHPRHPIGTLAIVAIYGVIFAAGWMATYVFIFLERGRVSP